MFWGFLLLKFLLTDYLFSLPFTITILLNLKYTFIKLHKYLKIIPSSFSLQASYASKINLCIKYMQPECINKVILSIQSNNIDVLYKFFLFKICRKCQIYKICRFIIIIIIQPSLSYNNWQKDGYLIIFMPPFYLFEGCFLCGGKKGTECFEVNCGHQINSQVKVYVYI